MRSGAELREDALAMIRFWHTMHSDKKYLKQSLVGSSDSSDTISMSGIMVQDTMASTSSYQLAGGNRSTSGSTSGAPGSANLGLHPSSTSATLQLPPNTLNPPAPPLSVRSASSNDLVARGGTLPGSGWANTVPLANNATSSLSRRVARVKRSANPDSFVKEYTKKRNLILTLLAAEVVIKTSTFHVVTIFVLF